MKTHAGFKELVDKALEDALADLRGADISDNSPEAVVALKKNRVVAGAEIARRKKGEAKSVKIARDDSAQVRQSFHRSAAGDSRLAPILAQFSGIVDHNSALLAVAGAAVSADCDSCLDAVVPELAGVGMSKDDVRAAVESGRFPGAFPHLNAETFQRACTAAGEEGLDCIEG